LAKRDPVEFARQVGVEPDEWQARFLRSDSRRVLLNCSRQAGKSTTTALKSLHVALHEPGSLVLVLGPAERQAKEFFGKAATFYRRLGNPVPAESDRKLGLELANGSRIEALPGAERTIRGFSGVRLLILDEASRVEDGLYYAVRPMLAVSGGTLMMLSSPYGKRGVFYEEWSGDGDWERYEVTAHDCPRITQEFLAEERERLPLRVYRQEYMCSFEETEDALFSHEEVQDAVTDDVTPLFA
jgi:phage FluMu gp28-like protein